MFCRKERKKGGGVGGGKWGKGKKIKPLHDWRPYKCKWFDRKGLAALGRRLHLLFQGPYFQNRSTGSLSKLVPVFAFSISEYQVVFFFYSLHSDVPGLNETSERERENTSRVLDLWKNSSLLPLLLLIYESPISPSQSPLPHQPPPLVFLQQIPPSPLDVFYFSFSSTFIYIFYTQ